MDATNALAATTQSQAGNLRRALKAVIAEAEEALTRMDAGNRPGSSITGRLLPSTGEAEAMAARLDMLLNWSGSPMLAEADAIDALKNGRPA